MTRNILRSTSVLLLLTGLALLTLAPYGGCSCYNPVSPSDGPTPTPTPTLGPVVANFENSSTGNIFTYTGLPVTAISNPSGTPASHDSTSAIDVGSGAPSGTPGKSLRFFGTIGQDGAPYPWTQVTLPFGGTVTQSYINAYTGLKFWIKSNNTPKFVIGGAMVPPPHFRVNFTDGVITEGGAWYKCDFTAGTTWTQISVHFPGGAPPVFAQPAWATQPKTWLAPNFVKYSLNAVVFQAFPNSSGAWNYDFQVDDVTFF